MVSEQARKPLDIRKEVAKLRDARVRVQTCEASLRVEHMGTVGNEGDCFYLQRAIQRLAASSEPRLVTLANTVASNLGVGNLWYKPLGQHQTNIKTAAETAALLQQFRNNATKASSRSPLEGLEAALDVLSATPSIALDSLGNRASSLIHTALSTATGPPELL